MVVGKVGDDKDGYIWVSLCFSSVKDDKVDDDYDENLRIYISIIATLESCID